MMEIQLDGRLEGITVEHILMSFYSIKNVHIWILRFHNFAYANCNEHLEEILKFIEIKDGNQ